MTPDHLTEILQALGTLVTAILALIAAIKSSHAHAEVKALRAQANRAAVENVPGMNPSDVFRYAALIQKGLAFVKQMGRLAVGQTAPVPPVKFDLPDGERLSLAPTTVTRER